MTEQSGRVRSCKDCICECPCLCGCPTCGCRPEDQPVEGRVQTPSEALASRLWPWNEPESRERCADMVLAALADAGYAVVPIGPDGVAE